LLNNSHLVEVELEKDENVDYIKLIQTQSKQFFIGKKKHEFDPHEQIFFLRDSIKT